VERRLAAVLAADVAGYSRLMGIDEEGTLARLKTVRKTLVDPTIASHRGRIVKTTGDGMLIEFASAVDAVRGAVEVQRDMAKQNASVPQDTRIEFRVGIHVGDIIIDDDDIFGDGVNVAARLESIAEPGGVCMSNDAYRQVRGKVEMVCDDMGPQPLKNIAEPMQVWRVRLTDQTAATVQSGSAVSQPRALPLPDKPSIAVLPFQNMSGDPEQEYFADGMVEDIITALSRFKSLFVIARNSSFTYKGKAMDIKQVGRELGVRYVLEGSVRKAGGRARITAQLIEASTGAHLWADRFDQSLEDIFTLQDNITMSVVGAIAPRLVEARTEAVVRKPADRWEVYDCYLQAVRLQHQWTLQATLEAQKIFREIIKADPQFALAYARLAWNVQVLRDFYQQPVSEADRIEALALAEKALALSDNDEVVLTTVVYVFGFLGDDNERGRELADRALAINPNMSGGWNARGLMCLRLGEPDVALDAFTRVIRLNPLDQRAVPLAMLGCSSACLLLGRYEESEAWARKLLAIQPSGIRGLIALLGALIARGKEQEAEATILKIKQEHPHLRASQLRQTYRVARPDAMTLVERSIARLGLPE
jgi:TolB-like protein/class 3 adenylate cyclase